MPTGSGVGADERPGGPSGSVPRRQRCTRRRLSFGANDDADDDGAADGDARAADTDARAAGAGQFGASQNIERHTSGIYDLIDAIGLLGMRVALSSLSAIVDT